MFSGHKQQLQNSLQQFLQTLVIECDPAMAGLYEMITGYVLEGGKRVRPLLYLLAYEGYCESFAGVNSDIEAVMPGAVALELMHNFALIHDDLIDRSRTRRGRPSLQVSFADYLTGHGRCAESGADLAILAGDILYSLALKTCTQIKSIPERTGAVLTELLNTAVRTGSGVFSEVYLRSGRGRLSEEQILQLYRDKTAYYSFSCPLKMGAILAGADSHEIERLGEFAQLLGLAYQINDDISDFSAICAESSEVTEVHLQELRTTLPFYYLCRECPETDRLWLDDLGLSGVYCMAEVTRLKGLLRRTGALESAQQRAGEYLLQARAQCSCLGLGKDSAGRLLDCLNAYLVLEPQILEVQN